MKRIILKMGVLGVFCLVAGCSDDGSTSPLQPVADDPEGITSTESTAKSSSSGASQSNSSPSSNTSKDTTVIHQQVIITDSGDVVASYVSSGVFCWTAGCEAEYASSSSAAPQSSETITITVSSSSAVPPTVTGTQMVDNRNNKTYKLQNVAGKLWMAENLNYETSNGSFCSLEGGDDYCAKYGRYYIYSAAMRACPDGWRLPTTAEVEALDAAVEHEWWSIGGRFKVNDGTPTDFGMEDEQGYIWLQTEGENNSFRVKNYDGDHEHTLQGGSGTDRAYNVRCVQD